MKVRYNVTGAKRKELVQTIEKITGTKAIYKKAPTFAYEVGNYVITKEGTLVVPDIDREESEDRVLEGLKEAGFQIDDSDVIEMTVSLPKEDVNIENLKRILEAKGSLIKKALGINDLPIEVKSDMVSFPWFVKTPDAESVHAYTQFIAGICRMSKEKNRITAKAKEVENEKYAFRCFLLRLGFIGEDYKTDRKILLKNLSGSSAFKGGAKDEISQ